MNFCTAVLSGGTSATLKKRKTADDPAGKTLPVLTKSQHNVEGGEATSGRGKRKINKPARYLAYDPPCENKPRSEKVTVPSLFSPNI